MEFLPSGITSFARPNLDFFARPGGAGRSRLVELIVACVCHGSPVSRRWAGFRGPVGLSSRSARSGERY